MKKVAFPFCEEANLPGFISSILSSLFSLCSNLDLYSVTEGVIYSENNATMKECWDNYLIYNSSYIKYRLSRSRI